MIVRRNSLTIETICATVVAEDWINKSVNIDLLTFMWKI